MTQHRIMKRGNLYAVQTKVPLLPIWIGYYNILDEQFARELMKELQDKPEKIA